MRRAIQIFAMTAIAMSVAAAASARDRHDRADEQNASSPMALLTWPGKTEGVLPARPVQSASAPAATAPSNLYDSPPPRWRAPDVSSAQPPQPQAQPQAPSQAPSQAMTQARQGDGVPPHFYSVARQYGVQPDPVQLSPQFLAATPQSDMAEPPPPPPPHTAGPQAAGMSTAAATNQLRQAQEAAADADAAALGN